MPKKVYRNPKKMAQSRATSWYWFKAIYPKGSWNFCHLNYYYHKNKSFAYRLHRKRWVIKWIFIDGRWDIKPTF